MVTKGVTIRSTLICHPKFSKLEKATSSPKGIGSWNARFKEHDMPHSAIAGARASLVMGAHGPSPFTLQSLESNIDSFKAVGIHWNELPKTFQDTIYISQALGITYLWIDKLCILQDSRLDWEVESGMMKAVYEAATVVIAAMSSPSDEHGFLGLRRKHVVQQVTMGTLENPSHAQVARHIDHEWSFSLSHLSRRGWTFQERLVARCVLSFTDWEMSWECNTTWCCECGVRDRIPRAEFSRHEGHLLGNILDDADEHTLHEIWRINVVQKYSRRALTKSCDKLPAISAIAKVFLECLNHSSLGPLPSPPITYAAGIWHNTNEPMSNETASSLLWRAQMYHQGSDEATPHAEARPYRAPSWSWASLDAPIKYDRLMNVSLFADSSIQKIRCPPSGKDSTGEVAEGSYIVIKGHLSPALRMKFQRPKLNSESPNKFYYFLKQPYSGSPKNVGILHDCSLTKHEITSPNMETIFCSARRRRSDEDNSYEEIGVDVKVFCLHIAKNGAGLCYSLVLGKLQTSPDKYCRLGILYTRHPSCRKWYRKTLGQDATQPKYEDVMIV